MMRRLLSLFCMAATLSLAGCHTCDVCDDCGDCGGCGNGYHGPVHADPSFGPGYAAPAFEGTVSSSAKRIPMHALPTTPKMQAAKPSAEKTVR
jgi:hypothetical protein